jgi:uncharacterized protein YcnI
MNTPPHTGARAVGFGIASTALAALGHGSVAGGPLDPSMVAAITALTALIARLFTVRERGLGEILCGLVGVQLIFHAAAGSAAGHVHHVLRPSPGMLTAHLLAVLVTAWWLRRGEAALWARIRRTVAVARALRPGWPDQWPACLSLSVEPAQRAVPAPRPLVDCVSGRGPPLPVVLKLVLQRWRFTQMHRKLLAIGVAVAAFVAPATAFGHVAVSPGEVQTNDFVEFTMSVPNEKNIPTTKVRLLIPDGVTVSVVEQTPGWKWTITRTNGRITALTVRGSLPVAHYRKFSFLAGTPATPGILVWKAIQTYKNGAVVRWTGEPGQEEASETVVTDAGAPGL